MITPIPQLPLSDEQLARLQDVTKELSLAQLTWISGYLWGRLTESEAENLSQSLPPVSTAPSPKITLISASQTGNARRIAEQLRDDLLAAHLNIVLVNAGEYKFKQIAQEKLLLMVTLTQGEGEPPEEAVALYKFLHSKKAPAMENTAFAVLGWGTRPIRCSVRQVKILTSGWRQGSMLMWIISWRPPTGVKLWPGVYSSVCPYPLRMRSPRRQLALSIRLSVPLIPASSL